jgi:hypothetical protein
MAVSQPSHSWTLRQGLSSVRIPGSFGSEETIKRLRKGESNTSELRGGVLQRNNIHDPSRARLIEK